MMSELASQLAEVAHSKGHTWTWESTPTALMLIVTEASEAMEDWRDDKKRECGEELADIIIRTLHLASDLGIDIQQEIDRKTAKNKLRPYNHGRAIL